MASRRPAARDEEAVARFVQRLSAELAAVGFPRMAARVFVALLASESGQLTAAEVGEQLRVSPAAVSGAVRYLEQMNLVRREREPGSRRDRFCVYDDVWYEAIMQEQKMYARLADAVREGIKATGPRSEAGRRLAETASFLEFVEREMPELMARWRRERGRIAR